MASREDISAEINALAVHCRPPIMSAEERAAWTVDWINDLSGFPLDAVRTGFRKWRHSGSAKFPTPGQLLPLVRDSLPIEKAPGVKIWRKATQAEFAGMSVREKIHELTILAHEERSKAGPMFRNTTPPGALSKVSGKHLEPADMSVSYRGHTAEAERLEVEIGRLRRVLSTPYAQAAE